MIKTPIQQISSPIIKKKKLSVFIKRDDLIHPYISGNKWRKSYYLIQNMLKNNVKTALTFGGAYSNHIYSFAYACKKANIKSIGFIRGDELAYKPLNSTLKFAKQCGMELIFVSRKEYQNRYDIEYQNNLSKLYNAQIVPEGGTTPFVVEGFKDMIEEIDLPFEYVITASGTGGTAAGIAANLKKKQTLISIPVLKGVEKKIEEKIIQFSSHKNYHIIPSYHQGGYAKTNSQLNNFINSFDNNFCTIEKTYTGKMFFALFDLINKDYFPEYSTIIALHTGGLQAK